MSQVIARPPGPRCKLNDRIDGVILFAVIFPWLCLLLTVCSAFALVLHRHSDATDAAKCTICIAAHSTAFKAKSALQNTSFVVVLCVRENPVAAHQTLTVFALLVCPPPYV